MDINQYLQLHKDIVHGQEYSYRRNAPRLYCKDGFNISVQVSHGHYCSPREDDAIAYSEVELGYPNLPLPPIFKIWAEDKEAGTDTVWAYVPVSVVDWLIEQHGGIEYPLERLGERNNGHRSTTT